MNIKRSIITLVFAISATTWPSLAYNSGSTDKKPVRMGIEDIKVHSAWARALPPVTPNGAVYLTVENNSNKAVRIVSAKSPVADKVTLHKNITHSDHIMMEQQPFIEIKANQRFFFKPGSYHFMLISLNTHLQTGQHFPLTLTFEKAGEIQVNVAVKNNADDTANHQHRHH